MLLFYIAYVTFIIIIINIWKQKRDTLIVCVKHSVRKLNVYFYSAVIHVGKSRAYAKSFRREWPRL